MRVAHLAVRLDLIRLSLCTVRVRRCTWSLLRREARGAIMNVSLSHHLAQSHDSLQTGSLCAVGGVKDSGEKWRFRHAKIEYGPYSPESLKDVLRSAGIDSDLELKRESDREWVRVKSVDAVLSAADLSTLLSNPSGERPSASPSSKASQTSHRSHEAAGSHAASPTPLHRSPVGRADGIARRVSTHLPSDKLIWIAGITIWLGGNAWAIYDLCFGDAFAVERRYAATLNKAFADRNELAKRNASNDEWDAFRAQTNAELAPMLKDLEKTADLDHPARQHLLFAVRDALPPLLYRRDGGNQEGADGVFLRHMREVNRQISSR